MSTPLVFKKYANRRLYSMSDSKYVSLFDLSKIIREGHDISVFDAKTKEDVTTFVLTQIILEEAKNKNTLLPSPLLHMIIRYGDNILLDFFETHLRWIIERYIEFKQAADRQFLSWLDFGKNLTETAREGLRAMSPFNEHFSENGSSKGDDDPDQGK